MLARAFALMMMVTIGALALEVVFGVHLGIAGWVHGLLDPGGMSLMPL